jgi:hypothetical protein
VLERNDVAILLRSDSRDHLAHGAGVLDLDFLDVTSVRRGFVGGGLPKKMSMAAGVPGADLVPETAQLFLGFTSTQKDALGPRLIANHETLGLVELGPRHYFRQGTHMHVSHLFEDLEAWYLNFDFDERVATAFQPGRPHVREGTLTVPQPRDAPIPPDVERDFRAPGPHRPQLVDPAVVAAAARLRRDDGTVYQKGTAIPQRADFNTLDNPFAWSSRGESTEWSPGPRAGLHFVVFNPSSDDFHRNRLAMDGRLPTGRSCRSARGPASRASTRSCARPTARTSSCRRAATARSRWQSSRRDMSRDCPGTCLNRRTPSPPRTSPRARSSALPSRP